jgi:hypothetical protein
VEAGKGLPVYMPAIFMTQWANQFSTRACLQRLLDMEEHYFGNAVRLPFVPLDGDKGLANAVCQAFNKCSFRETILRIEASIEALEAPTKSTTVPVREKSHLYRNREATGKNIKGVSAEQRRLFGRLLMLSVHNIILTGQPKWRKGDKEGQPLTRQESREALRELKEHQLFVLYLLSTAQLPLQSCVVTPAEPLSVAEEESDKELNADGLTDAAASFAPTGLPSAIAMEPLIAKGDCLKRLFYLDFRGELPRQIRMYLLGKCADGGQLRFLIKAGVKKEAEDAAYVRGLNLSSIIQCDPVLLQRLDAGEEGVSVDNPFFNQKLADFYARHCTGNECAPSAQLHLVMRGSLRRSWPHWPRTGCS